MKLYELTSALTEVWEKINDEEVDLNTLEDTLQSIEGAIEVKAEGLARLILMLDYDSKALDDELKRLKARRAARENRLQRIKQYLQQQMELLGTSKISTPVLTITLQSNPVALEVLDEMAIPTEYLVHVPARNVVDAAKVKEALKAGATVPGAQLTQGKSVRIR